MKANALWHTTFKCSAILQEELPDINDQMLLVESLYSLVSLGTEKLVASALIPVSIADRMAVPYMDGTFSLPCKYGYSLVGKITRGPGEYLHKTVHLMHPHQDKLWVNASSVYEVPEEIPAQRAVLASQVETAVNAVWDSRISLGDRVLVAGFGLVGAITAILAAGIPGVRVAILEKNEFRKEMAREMGFIAVEKPEDHTETYDVAIHTAGDERALQFCIDHIGYEGRVTEVSFYGKKPVILNLGETFHSGRKGIIASQVSEVPSERKNRWDHGRRKNLVFDLLKDNRFDFLTGNVVPFEKASILFNQIRYGLINDISVIFRYT